jgi:hypothetical protein
MRYPRPEHSPLEGRPGAVSCVLVDFDNFFPGDLGTQEQLRQQLARMVDLALSITPDVEAIDIRLYGGWLEDGVLSRRASELQALIGPPALSRPHPNGAGTLRITVQLVTRLMAVPALEWGHTLRSSRGFPRLRLAEGPQPDGCMDAANCPIRLVQRMSQRRNRQCQVTGCQVLNEDAFRIREQKMVDALITCDSISYGEVCTGMIVLSNDLDVLPGLTVAVSNPLTNCEIALVRGSPDEEGLYDLQLREMGVLALDWEAA